jgi:hypothetical protein
LAGAEAGVLEAAEALEAAGLEAAGVLEDELSEDELPEDALPEDELSEDELSEDALPEDAPPEDAPSPSFFTDEYRSLYQPPPLRWNALCEMMRSRAPLHSSHSVFRSSLMRCMYSKTLWQL